MASPHWLLPARTHIRHALATLRLLLATLLCAAGLGLSAPLPALASATMVGDDAPAPCTREALHEALIAGGVITLNCSKQPFTIDLSQPIDGKPTPEAITKDTTIDGKGLATLSGGGTQRILTVSPGVRLTLRGLTLAHGYAGEDQAGGAIFNGGGIVTIEDTIFTNNTAFNEGGAIANRFGGTLTIEDTTFAANHASTVGGAIYSFSGAITIRDSWFTNNDAEKKLEPGTGPGHGGAIYADATPLTIARTHFVGNRALGAGGAIVGGVKDVPSSITDSRFINNIGRQNAGAIANSGLLTLEGDTFVNNAAPSDVFASGAGRGGAVLSTGALTVRGSRFQGNTGFSYGGAIASDGGTLLVSDSSFANNRTIAAAGGAITANNGATFTVERSTFTGNSAGRGGGALYTAGNAMVSDSSFSRNAAFFYASDKSDTLGVGGASGGAILNGGSGATRTLDIIRSAFVENSAAGGPNSSGGAIANSTVGVVTVSNSTFARNTAFGSGGALLNGAGGLRLTVVNSTLAENSAADGSGLAGTATISNSIIANNFGGDNCTGTITAAAPNLEFPGDRCNASIKLDPRLGSLDYHGGRTLNFSLDSHSPAIDKGDNAVCALPGVDNLDQRGRVRPIGAACDLGAHERGSPPPSGLAGQGNADEADLP